jgi:flagellar biosynthesis/type III secretory pathway M-ring protein FliF/YscJ
LILAFALALLAIRAVRTMPQPQATLALASGSTGTSIGAPNTAAHEFPAPVSHRAPVELPVAPPTPRYNFRPADTQVRDKVITTVDENPDNAARLVKAWIKEG